MYAKVALLKLLLFNSLYTAEFAPHERIQYIFYSTSKKLDQIRSIATGLLSGDPGGLGMENRGWGQDPG